MQTAPVQKLSQLQAALNAEESPIMRQVFSVLFPFGPALNSILGTFYISSCVFQGPLFFLFAPSLRVVVCWLIPQNAYPQRPELHPRVHPRAN